MNFLKNISDWKKFPDTQTLGYYHSIGNYIYLSEYKNEEDFQKSIQNPSLDKNRFSVFIHEMQHYYDQVSTLWGVKKLYKLYQAYDAVIKFNEHEFYKFRDLELSFKRDYFLDYFTETYKEIKGDFNNKWAFRISSGLRFSYNGKVDENLPILFIVFGSSKGEKISRVPLSVVTLLETTATFQEFNFLMLEASKLDSPFKENQIKVISKKFENLLYDPKLTLYSAAVHIVSVNLQILSPIEGYKASSLFAKISLNLPSQIFSKIKIHSEFQTTKDWEVRSQKMLDNNERGFAFLLLVRNYVTEFGVDKDSLTVENILKASNLPSEQEILNLISKEIEELDLKTLLDKNNLNREVIDKVFWGSKFRESTGLAQQNKLTDLSKFERDKPFLIFSETYFEYENLELKPIYEKLISQQKPSIDEWFRFYTMCEKRIDNFNTICGI